MRPLTCLTLFLLLFFGTANAQTTTDSVKAAVNSLFTAMKQADSTALMQSFAPGAVLQTIVKDKQGLVSVRTEAISKFASSIGQLPKDAADERITFDVVKIDGDLAIAWTPYSFYFQQKLSHCGVNSFQLVRLAEGWKIQYIIDTRRKNGCQ
ncbi:nuclear transport factor 2 family protein [Chitinophaga sp. S165]|uniref:nuclear transport factor 2 family protein n=1 Tax=Chitinophaga sp. S165 TaxID=2135462 RepID=UPI000D719460|nr:nuclear transport factor 2 family protein [Chitinophaga sp. S165]PWV55660.1 putative lumazine-binding protein [Chitinophaga sp. S165]